MNRRAMLLALGVPIPAGLVEEKLVEDVGPLSLTLGLNATLGIEILHVSMKSMQEKIDVTTFGDSTPKYIAGIRRETVEVIARPVCAVEPHVFVGATMPIDWVMGDYRIEGELVIDSFTVAYGSTGAARQFRLTAQMTKPMTWTEVTPPVTLPDGLRAMKLT